MYKEVEIKVLIKNVNEVQIKIQELGRLIKTKTQKDEYYSPMDDDYFSSSPADKYLRVRFEEGKNSLNYSVCHRSELGQLLSTDEYETEISNPAITSEILQKMGMVKRVIVIKRRQTFMVGKFEVVLDEIDGLGLFMEIEYKEEVVDVDKARNECLDFLKKLGIKYEEAPNMGYPDMMIQKN